ncbi:MAG: FAD-dependent thymidylate synthase [Candidatus Sumerlaeia bacterium]|nr:FAD-dependent thymidylate synthase [Candidatus Sumerlaeia bacterium]
MAKQCVLDKGFVRLIDQMGSDRRVVEAVRVSTGTVSDDPERDRKLIHFLIEHGHGTPFEKVVFEFHVKCPLFVARQWFRHRIGSFNERSARYRRFDEEYFVPDFSTLPEGYTADDLAAYNEALHHAYATYERLVAKASGGPEQRARAREVWRGLLGTSFYTEFFWTVNLRSLMNFLKLRMHPTAQYEIRQYAEAIAAMTREAVPISYEAFERFVLSREAGSI